MTSSVYSHCFPKIIILLFVFLSRGFVTPKYVQTDILLELTTDMEPLVVVEDLNRGHTVADKPLILECRTTFFLKYVDLEWVLPKTVNHALVTKNLSVDINSSFRTINRLTIDKVKIDYAGLYTCKVMHKQWNEIFAGELMVSVYGKNQHMIEFDRRSRMFIESKSEIQVNIKAHPEISITWLNPNNITISNESLQYITDSEYGCMGGQFNYCTRLYFKNFTREDYGYYKIIAKNKFETKSQSIIVFSRELVTTPVLSILNVNENTMSAEFECRAAGPHVLDLKWIFMPTSRTTCLNVVHFENIYSAVEHKLPYIPSLLKTETRSKVIGVKTFSYINLNFSEYGFLGCFEKHAEAVKLTKIIFYVQGGFSMSAENVTETSNGMRKVYVNYEHSVKILCAVNANEYIKKQRWYHNGKRFDGSFQRYMVSYNSLNKFFTHLEFSYYFENKMGNYSCGAVRKSGEVEVNTIEVIPRKLPSLKPQAFVEDLNNGHTLAGDDIQLKCEIVFYKHVAITWENYLEIAPKKIIEKRSILNSSIYITTSYATYNSSVSSFYMCSLQKPTYLLEDDKPYKGVRIQVYDREDGDIIFDQEQSSFDTPNMQLKIFVTSHPKPTIRWFFNSEEININSSRFNITLQPKPVNDDWGSNYETTLVFNHIIEFDDFGNYTVVATNKYKEKSFSTIINLKDRIITRLDLHHVNEENMTGIFKCTSVGYPAPTIQWYFAKCSSLFSCLDFRAVASKKFVEIKELSFKSNGLQIISYISVGLQDIGMLKCSGKNHFHTEDATTYSFQPILYIPDGFSIFADNILTKDLMKTVEVVGTGSSTIICAVSLSNYTEEIVWYEQDVHDQSFYEMPVEQKTKMLVSLAVIYPSHETPGKYLYVCNALTKEGFLKSQELLIINEEKSSLDVVESNMDNFIQKNLTLGSKLTLFCYATGFPTPVITWYKNEVRINSSDNVKIMNNSQVLKLKRFTAEDEGKYKCEITNGFNTLSKTSVLAITSSVTWLYMVIPSVVLGFIMIITTVMVTVKIKKRNELVRKLNAVESHNSDSGAVEALRETNI